LPSVTLGKAFAECKIAFAVCLEHTAKELIPVVKEHRNFYTPKIRVLQNTKQREGTRNECQ
jgi:hypothetical protein